MLIADADGQWPPLQDGRRVLAFPLEAEGEGVAGQATNEGVLSVLASHPHPSCVRMPPENAKRCSCRSRSDDSFRPVQGEGYGATQHGGTDRYFPFIDSIFRQARRTERAAAIADRGRHTRTATLHLPCCGFPNTAAFATLSCCRSTAATRAGRLVSATGGRRLPSPSSIRSFVRQGAPEPPSRWRSFLRRGSR